MAHKKMQPCPQATAPIPPPHAPSRRRWPARQEPGAEQGADGDGGIHGSMTSIFDHRSIGGVDRRALERRVLSGLRALSAADGLLNAAVAAAMGIHPTDLLAADALDREGPMTVGALARALHLSPGAATALVDRLERAGLAARRPDPTSRRRVLVTPTG